MQRCLHMLGNSCVYTHTLKLLLFWKCAINVCNWNNCLHKLKFYVYYEARQSSQLFSPDRFRKPWTTRECSCILLLALTTFGTHLAFLRGRRLIINPDCSLWVALLTHVNSWRRRLGVTFLQKCMLLTHCLLRPFQNPFSMPLSRFEPVTA